MGMASELREAPDAVRRQAERLAGPVAELVARLHRWPPSVVVTCARGSSAHAATFAKHLIELYLGVPVAAAAPNIASVYRRRLRLEGQLFLAVSQSGRSDDLVANAAMARQAGALTAALVNDTREPARRGVRHRAADLRRAGAQRRRDQDLRRQPRRAAAARRRLGRGPTASPAAVERLPERLARRRRSRLERRDRPDRRGVEPRRDRPRPDPGDRPRGGAETEGGRQPARRGVQRRRVPARAGGAGRTRYPILVLMPTDAAAEGMRRLSADLADKGAALFAAALGRRAAGARPGPSRNRRGLPDPDLLRDDGRRSRRGSASTRTGRATCKRSRARDDQGRDARAETACAVAADIVFDGAALHRDGAVVIEGADIAALVPRRDLPAGIPLRAMPPGPGWRPGFIDVQVNGGGDVLFNDRPTPDGIAAIAAAHRRFGTTGLLPTLISDTPEKMRRASEAVAAAMRVCPGVLGIHFEGPFLSPERAGRARSGDVPLARRCGSGVADRAARRRDAGDAGPGMRAVRLCRGAVASRRAGRARPFDGELRTDARRARRGADRLHPSVQRDAAAAGARPRADRGGARRPWRVLRADRRWRACRAGDAAPGVARPGHAMLVTDAMPPVGGSRGAFRLCGKDIVARDGRVATGDGVLAGSALDMASAVRNCVRLLGMACPRRCGWRRPPRPLFSGCRTASAASRRAIAPTSSRSTPMRSGCWRPGSPARGTRRTVARKAHAQRPLRSRARCRHSVRSREGARWRRAMAKKRSGGSR